MERKLYPLGNAIIFLTLYAAWCFIFRIVAKTLITYFSRSTETGLHDIADSFSSSGLTITALATLSFLWLVTQLGVFQGSQTKGLKWGTLRSEWLEIKSNLPIFVRGGLQGGLLALSLLAALILNGDYIYLGAFVQMNEPIAGFVSLLLRAFALVLMIGCEQILFALWAQKIKLHSAHWISQALGGGISYAFIKAVQFDIGVMQGITLFLIGALGALIHFRQPIRHSGFLVGLLGMIHLGMGQPLFGSNFNGIFLFRVTESESIFKVFFTGGLGGPLSSFALQVILLVLLLSRVTTIATESRRRAS